MFEAEEQRVVHRALELDDTSMGKLMTQGSEAHCLLLTQTNEEAVALQELLHEPTFLAASEAPIEAIKAFRDSGLHIVFVQDEAEQFQGIVTPGKILESLGGGFGRRGGVQTGVYPPPLP